MAMHTPRALPSALGPALQTHLQKHFRGHAMLHPHWAPEATPMYLRPWAELGAWFHELPLPATIPGPLWPPVPAPPWRA